MGAAERKRFGQEVEKSHGDDRPAEKPRMRWSLSLKRKAKKSAHQGCGERGNGDQNEHGKTISQDIARIYSLSERIAALDDPDQEHDDGDHQKDVDKPPDAIEPDYSKNQRTNKITAMVISMIPTIAVSSPK